MFNASRPTLHGLEMHLVVIHKLVKKFKSSTIILDPITNLITVGSVSEVKGMLIRLIDFLQGEQVTVMFTALTLNNTASEQTDEGVSSLVDAWVLVREVEYNGERNRGLYIMKSRGMKHSNRVREFVITNDGLDIVDVYQGPEGVLTGSAREAQQLLIETGSVLRDHAILHKDREIERKRSILESKIAALNEEFASIKDELNKSHFEEEIRREIMLKNKEQLKNKG
jgi:circadian clock protein KaiC